MKKLTTSCLILFILVFILQIICHSKHSKLLHFTCSSTHKDSLLHQILDRLLWALFLTISYYLTLSLACQILQISLERIPYPWYWITLACLQQEFCWVHFIKNPPMLDVSSIIFHLANHFPFAWHPESPWRREATHSSILAWRIPLNIYSIRLQRVRNNWATFTSFHFFPLLKLSSHLSGILNKILLRVLTSVRIFFNNTTFN